MRKFVRVLPLEPTFRCLSFSDLRSAEDSPEVNCQQNCKQSEARGDHTRTKPPLDILEMPAQAVTTLSSARYPRNHRISANTISGKTYILEYKDSLSQPQWTTASTITGDGTAKLLADTLANVPQRFYRVRESN